MMEIVPNYLDEIDKRNSFQVIFLFNDRQQWQINRGLDCIPFFRPSYFIIYHGDFFFKKGVNIS